MFDSGYQDGYRQGRDDARDGDRFDPRGQREYRNADNGRYRSNDARRVYRQGFERGYEEGYRDARGPALPAPALVGARPGGALDRSIK